MTETHRHQWNADRVHAGIGCMDCGLSGWDWAQGERVRLNGLLSEQATTLRKCRDALAEIAVGDEHYGGTYVMIAQEALAESAAQPTPMLLRCPACANPHVDRDEWATRLHKTHLCEYCRFEWRPANIATVGVVSLETTFADDLQKWADVTEPGTISLAGPVHD